MCTSLLLLLLSSHDVGYLQFGNVLSFSTYFSARYEENGARSLRSDAPSSCVVATNSDIIVYFIVYIFFSPSRVHGAPERVVFVLVFSNLSSADPRFPPIVC